MKKSKKAERQKKDKVGRLYLTYSTKKIITPNVGKSANISEDSESFFDKSLRFLKSHWRLFFLLFLVISMPLLPFAFAALQGRRNNERADPKSPNDSPCTSYRLINGAITKELRVLNLGSEHEQFKVVNDCLEILSEQRDPVIVVESVPAGREIECSFVGIKGNRCIGGDTKNHVEWTERKGMAYVYGQHLKSFLQKYNDFGRNDTKLTNYIKEQMELALSALSRMEAAENIDPEAYDDNDLLLRLYKDPEREYIKERSRVRVMKELLAHSDNGLKYIDFFKDKIDFIKLKHPASHVVIDLEEVPNRQNSIYDTSFKLSKKHFVITVFGKNHFRSKMHGLNGAAKDLIRKFVSSESEMPFAVLYQTASEKEGCSNEYSYTYTQLGSILLCVVVVYIGASLIVLKGLIEYEKDLEMENKLKNPNTLAGSTTQESSTLAPS